MGDKPAQKRWKAIGSRQGLDSVGDWEIPVKSRPKDFLDT